jgi:spermidine synthase
MKHKHLFLPILVGGGLFLAAGAAIIAVWLGHRHDPGRGLVFRGKSPYGEIRVVDDGGFRYLLVDGAIRAAVDTSLDWESAMTHVNVIDVARSFHEGPGKLLLIGLGGGSVAEHFHRSGWEVDAVEIDSLVVSVARRFFGFDSTHARVSRMDGRQFIAAAADTYDVIIVDAFGSSSIPVHLLTEEAFGWIATRLGLRGTLAVNVRALGWHDTIVRSIAATLGTAFPNVLALPIAEPPDQLGNVILLASKGPLEIPGDFPVPFDRFTGEYDRFHAWENRFAPDTKGVPVLTDANNPLDRMVEAISVRERKQVRETFTKH